MKRKMKLLAFGLAASTALAACAQEATTAEETTAAEETTEEGAGAQQGEETDGADESFLADEDYLHFYDADDYVTLGEYKGLKVTLSKTEITEEQIDQEIVQMSSMLPGEEVTDRPVQEGDVVNIDYEGKFKDSGEAFDGGTAEGASLAIGSGSFIDGFEDGLIGVAIGETVDLELQFPDPYQNNPDLSGVDVIFTVTVNGITAQPEITEETVGEVMEAYFDAEGISSIEEMRAYVKEQLEEQAAQANDNELYNRALDMAVENAEFTQPLPEKPVRMYRYQIDRSLEQWVSMYQLYGYADVTKESLLTEMMGGDAFSGTADEFILEMAEDQAKSVLVAMAIAKAENDLTPSDDEIDESVENTLTQNGFSSAEEYAEVYGLRLEELVREDLLVNYVVEFISDNAQVAYE